MTTDLLPQTPLDDSPAAEALWQDPGANDGTRAKWVIRGILAGGVVLILAAGAAFLPSAFSKDEDRSLTHTISRADLNVSVIEQGTLESSNNTEVKCKVRGFSTVTWVIPAGSVVQPGDELVRLDTKVIEEQYSLTKTNTFIATAKLEESKANVAKAEIAFIAYSEGRFPSQMQALQKELAAKVRNHTVAGVMLDESKDLFKKGYATKLEVDGNAFTLTQAELELKVKQTEIEVLNKFTKLMELKTLEGDLTANKSKLAADEAGLAMEIKRRNRAEEELKDCVITAERGGLVIYPSAAAWKRTPDITEGASVRKDQVLLLMPDLTKMQIKVGVHESVVDRVKPGLKAKVTLPDRTLDATVSSVASVTRPAGWWTGNVVKYDTIIELPSDSGLRPGMSAEVEVIIAEHEDVLTVPVAAIVETDDADFCWVESAKGEIEKRVLRLGDSNDVFVIVEGGLKEGDEVVLNPTAHIKEAKNTALATLKAAETDALDTESAGEADNNNGN